VKIAIGDCARALGVDGASVIWCSDLNVLTAEDTLAEARAECEREVRVQPASGHFATAFQGLFTRMGYPDTVPAGAKLRARIAESGLKQISPIVDAYNLVSARYAYGIGAHDAARLPFQESVELTIRRSVEGDGIVPLLGSKTKRLPVGDLIYTVGDRTVAWLGKRDVDADEFKLLETTQIAFFVLIGVQGIAAAELDEVGRLLVAYLRRVCPRISATTFTS
jgi:DNA/RNA-binding domain of Phe-tRNA-synthetase-like protein